MVRSLLVLLLLTSPVLAEDAPVDIPAAQKIWFPALPVPDKVPDAPAPPADPDAVPILAYGQIYAVQSDVEFFLRAYPKSLVTIVPPVKGPVTVRGIFIAGGKVETRVLEGKYVAFVDAPEKASGRVDLVATPIGNANENSIVEQAIDVNTGARPPPKPDEPDVPDVPDKPDPPVVDTFKTLIQTVTAKYATLPAADKPKIAAAFRETSAKIMAGEIKDMQQLTKVTADTIVDKIGLNAFFPWVPWRDDITKALKSQPLVTPADHAAPWTTIADVLDGK